MTLQHAALLLIAGSLLWLLRRERRLYLTTRRRSSEASVAAARAASMRRGLGEAGGGRLAGLPARYPQSSKEARDERAARSVLYSPSGADVSPRSVTRAEMVPDSVRRRYRSGT